MLFDRQEGFGVRAIRDANLTVCQTNVQQVTEVIVGDVSDCGLLGHLIRSEGPLRAELAQIEEACILAFRADNELIFLVWHPSDSSNCIRVPILFLVIVSLNILASESETALALFFLLVLLLVLLHLELHHLHLPDAMLVIRELDFERLRVVDLFFVRLVDLIDVARFASDDNLGGVLVPLQVIDQRAIVELHHADWVVLLQVLVPICLEEEDFSVTCRSHQHCLRRRILKLYNGCIVRLEHYAELNTALVD